MNLIAEIVSALSSDGQVVLATTISSAGSTPLPPGAMMVFKPHGKGAIGTVGGGVFESNVSNEAAQMFGNESRFAIRSYELNESTAEEGMICGGNVDVLIERIGQNELHFFSTLVGLQNEGRGGVLLRAVDSSKNAIEYAVLEDISEEPSYRAPIDQFLKSLQIPAEKFTQTLQRSHRGELVERLRGTDGELIFTPVVGIQPLIIFGGGHIGRSVCRIAAAAGFTVTVVDDRREYADPARFPDASRIVFRRFLDGFDEIGINASSSIVIVTRGHEFDRDVVRRALTASARYIGMIGSGKKVAATFARLREEGVPLSTLRRVHAPIGLDIGAVTAEEIAVGIVAELIRVRRGVDGPSGPMADRMNSWFDHAT